MTKFPTGPQLDGRGPLGCDEDGGAEVLVRAGLVSVDGFVIVPFAKDACKVVSGGGKLDPIALNDDMTEEESLEVATETTLEA